MEGPSEDHIAELERDSALADAKLGVAEDFAWIVGVLSALLAYATLGHWVWSLAAFVAAFFLSVYQLRRESARAEDAYYMAAGLGKYMRARDNAVSD